MSGKGLEFRVWGVAVSNARLERLQVFAVRQLDQPGSGFRVGFEFWALDFGFRVWGFGFRVLGFGFGVEGFRLWGLGLGFRA